MKMIKAKPFLKWAGGKGQLLGEIKKYYPFEKNPNITKYAEPFVGGGAVLFDILNNFNLEEVYISDINKELINTYIAIRDNSDELIEKLEQSEKKYLRLSESDKKNFYLQQRERFNNLKKGQEENIEIAVLMIFLNKTCFNGLYRVNRKGEFNVPMGTYKKPLICDKDNLRTVSKKLQNVKIVCGDYKMSANFIDEKTFVYFDPPYRPLTTTSSFTAYNENIFNDKSQIELAEFVQNLNEKGVPFVVSNSDPKNIDKNDNFFECIYAKQNIIRTEATRMINSNSASRGKIKELLIVNF